MVSLQYKKALHGSAAKLKKKRSSKSRDEPDSPDLKSKSPKAKRKEYKKQKEIDVDYVMQNDTAMMRIFEKETEEKANLAETRNFIRIKEQKNIINKISQM